MSSVIWQLARYLSNSFSSSHKSIIFDTKNKIMVITYHIFYKVFSIFKNIYHFRITVSSFEKLVSYLFLTDWHTSNPCNCKLWIRIWKTNIASNPKRFVYFFTPDMLKLLRKLRNLSFRKLAKFKSFSIYSYHSVFSYLPVAE